MFGSCKEYLESQGYRKYKGHDNCPFCGSMNPVELAELIKEGKATMHGCDWKYGWPHKFYVDVTNPNPENQVVKCSRSYTDENGERKEDVEYGPEGPLLHFKFYSNHLALLDDETFEKVAPIISEACGVTWEKKDGEIYYRAPYHNYQRW